MHYYFGLSQVPGIDMSIKKIIAATAVAGVLAVSAAGNASSATITVDLGPSSQDFTLYGLGALGASGIGFFAVGQGAGTYDSGTDTSTFTLSGAITGGSPGYDSGTYAFVTAYAGADTPAPGPNSPVAQSNPSNTNEFYYDFLDPSTTMTLDLFGTPTGDHVIPLVAGGSFPRAGLQFRLTRMPLAPESPSATRIRSALRRVRRSLGRSTSTSRST